ncbi:MAG: preprotein translocase subunit SecE [Defluviicoccus sp.]|jgi:preprotein translocase subunit SecE|uniref:Protein translocase subunit SecE n=2 Tax=root TaxID=1 RepID=A0A564WF26_9PROT|nr:preprotein translocase subunit SecE [Defluviicoccus sp.]SUS05121.1 Protein translocase subunit SecE [uncultured Defluviicoccus sp.]VUX47090.1 Protein translocase subunit SecE [Candidatus Defluviicoccus seviourii]MDG4592363.1 preprotein translocase subunit SecE [Defluviicoccus sp.]MDS4010436.1 preprotein translocase subunit SecE [Defluviicoccus sp.]
MAKINIAQFVREVRQETAKVTWPTRRETALSTAMVMLMVVVAAVFFLVVDQLLAFGVRILLGI